VASTFANRNNGQEHLCSKTYPRNDPHTGEHLYDVSAATETDVRLAIESAEAAFPGVSTCITQSDS
jgi:acyl-CoA reductase-like NAD-dependent aldehyde dehydrogenase